jgi:hypothetical protein
MIASCPPQRKVNYGSLPTDLRPPMPQPPKLPIPTDDSLYDCFHLIDSISSRLTCPQYF